MIKKVFRKLFREQHGQVNIPTIIVCGILAILTVALLPAINIAIMGGDWSANGATVYLNRAGYTVTDPVGTVYVDDLLPNADSTWDIGASGTEFANGYFDKLYSGGSEVVRTATFVVAASNANAVSIAQSDYQCSGEDDQEQIQAAIDAMPAGGLLGLSAGTFIFTSPVTVTTGVAIKIKGEFAKLDRFYSFDTATSHGTVIFADGIDAFQVGGTTQALASFFELENVVISGKAVAGELYAADVYSAGAGIKLLEYVKYAHLKNVQVHRKGYGVWIVPGAGNEKIDRVLIENALFTYNYWGIYHAGNWLAYLHLKDIEGYVNQRSLVNVAPTYDLVIDGLDDEASSRNVTAGSLDTPVYIQVGRDAHIHRVTIDSECPAYAQMSLVIGDYGYVDLSDILLQGGIYRGLHIWGGATEYYFHLNGFHIGFNPTAGLTYRGGAGVFSVGIVITDAANGLIENGEVWATTKISNASTGIVKIKNVSTYITENSGTATVLNATTSIKVAHGLAAVPTRIQITPTLLSAVTHWWVSSKDSDADGLKFTITVDQDPGAGTATFDWRAQVGEG